MGIKLGGFIREIYYGKLWEFLNEVLEYVDIVYIVFYFRGYIDSIYFMNSVGF